MSRPPVRRRVSFLGGKGGVGKTTLAAAYALLLAQRGERTLVASTDPAHSLGDVLRVSLNDEPAEVATRLWACEIDGERAAARRVQQVASEARETVPREVMPAVERHLAQAAASPGTVESALVDRLTQLLDGVENATEVRGPGESSVPSGARNRPSARSSLRGARPIHVRPEGSDDSTGADRRWDRLVVDSAPTGHMLRVLSLPALLGPWIEGLVRQREQVSGTQRLVSGLLGRADEAEDPLLERLYARRSRLERARQQLLDEAIVHLVLVPERLPLAETVRAAETLADGGLTLGSLIVNRVVPTTEGGLLAGRREHQSDVLGEIRQRFGSYGLVEVPLLGGELTGTDELADVTEVLAGKL